MRFVLAGQDPGLERRARSVRFEHDEPLRLAHYARLLPPFLPDHVAKHAAVFEVVVVPGAVHLLDHAFRHHRQGDQLRMRVFQFAARRTAVVLENEDVTEPEIALQIVDPVAEGVEDILHLFFVEFGEELGVIRRLDDHLVRADAIHLVEEALTFPIEVAFDFEHRILVWYDANVPAGFVRAGAAAERKYLGRCAAFVAGTKGTGRSRHRIRYSFPAEFAGTRPVRCDYHPPVGDRIFPQFRQRFSLPLLARRTHQRGVRL